MGRINPGGAGMAGHNGGRLRRLDETARVSDEPSRKLAIGQRRDEGRRHGLTLIFDQDDDVTRWVAERLPIRFTPEEFGPCTTIGMADKNGKLVAGCVYHRWRGFDCEVTFASVTPRWTLRQNLAPLFHYPFVQRACTRITLIVGANNAAAIRTNLRLGFKPEGVVRRAYDGIHDAIILGMVREECAWI